MTQPLMPLATAVWLVENTTLTFQQIAEFCGMHEVEVQGVADDEIGANIQGSNPILIGQLSAENIKECESDPSRKLGLIELKTAKSSSKSKKTKYIPIAKRRDKPDAVAWLVKNYSEIPDNKIVKLIGTTKKTIEAIRSRTHSNIQAIQPKDPVLLGLCSQTELNDLISQFKKTAELES